ncbi:manganese transporter Smf1p [Monosporozyma unispora]|nr:Manganese transporter smf2 [Kazachstania unispora]
MSTDHVGSASMNTPEESSSNINNNTSASEMKATTHTNTTTVASPSEQEHTEHLSGEEDETYNIDNIRSEMNRYIQGTGSTILGSFSGIISILRKYSRFIGPGLMVSVSYMDPGNYSTAVAAGSAHRYKLLFSILVSNFMAAFWQSLCAKLGAVTGLDLAQNCRRHFPHGLNITLYILAEIAIIATDLAEVVGTAISLNILFGIPLALGVILTVVDVLIVLIAYKPGGELKIIRLFEAFVSLLVVLTVACFAVELCYVDLGSAKDIFSGFLPSKAVIEGDGLYLSLGILGATVMPHSLFLGSGVVQPRLRDYDIKKGYYTPDINDEENNHDNYKPSFEAINETLHYTIAELLISLFTVALFVNCAILIVAGSTLYGTTQDAQEADLFSIYNLLSQTLSKGAGLIFVLALLFSGQSAGIVCTLSGQMVSEGFLNWSVSPAIRRSITRAVAIAPCLILVLVAGRSGLSGALNASQVLLSLLLPFVSAPLIYFTCNKKVMRVQVNAHNNCQHESSDGVDNNNSSRTSYNPLKQGQDEGEVEDTEFFEMDTMDEQGETPETTGEAPLYADMGNSPFTTLMAVLVWIIVSALNFYMLISFSSGQDVHF